MPLPSCVTCRSYKPFVPAAVLSQSARDLQPGAMPPKRNAQQDVRAQGNNVDLDEANFRVGLIWRKWTLKVGPPQSAFAIPETLDVLIWMSVVCVRRCGLAVMLSRLCHRSGLLIASTHF